LVCASFAPEETSSSATFPAASSPTVSGLLAEIQDRYGVEIPDRMEAEYSTTDQNTGQVSPNLVPNLEQTQVIEAALARLPSPRYFAPLLIPMRNSDPGAITGGEYLGFNWPCFLDPRTCPGGFVYDRLLAAPALEIMLPDLSLGAALPVKSGTSSLLPTLEQISLETSQVTPNLTETVPWTTQGEHLTQSVIHEYAHAIDDAVSLANSPSVKEYWNRQAFTLVNENTWDVTNPLYVAFAQLTGWRTVSLYDYLLQYDPTEAAAALLRDPGAKTEFLWDRDPAVWGDLAHRRNRLTIYASYGPIQESFAEFYMTSILYPNLLKNSENRFFERLNTGLAADPKAFIVALVAKPSILLDPPNPSDPQLPEAAFLAGP